MLIDHYLPDYHVSSQHDVVIRASPAAVYNEIFNMDLSQSSIIRLLFRLRGMPMSALTNETLRVVKSSAERAG